MRKSSLSLGVMNLRGLHLIVLYILSNQALESYGIGVGQQLKCSEVKMALEKERSGIVLSGFPSSFENEAQLMFCPRGLSCCNKETEKVLGDWSKTEFVLHMQGHTQRTAGPLKLYASKWDDVMEDLFNVCQKDQHIFFKKIYGIFYQQSKDIFDRFWDEIRDYFVRGRTNLVDVTHGFFSELYQKMYQAMNAQYVMDEQYMSCVAETMNIVLPFDDIPQRLAMALQRSMVASRALSKSLKDAIEVSVQLGDASEPSESCYKALQVMHNCPACQGIPYSQPCPRYCLSVMESCLSRHIKLQKLWDDFINSTLGLLDQVSEKFNPEFVMKRKYMSISDAIMEFQSKSTYTNGIVRENCGSPKLVKRSTTEEVTSFVFERPSEDSLSPTLFYENSPIYRTVEEVRGVLSSTKGFWKSLPSKLCKEQHGGSEDATIVDKCWNGMSLQDYHTANNQSVSSSDSSIVKQETEDGSRDVIPSVFHEKEFRLQSILNQVQLASGGQDVEWFDQESDFDERIQFNGGGSGDFGASGDFFGNGLFSGDGLDLEDPSYGSGDNSNEDNDDNDWNAWNPFSTSTTESTVEMGVNIVEAAGSSLPLLSGSTMILEMIITHLL